MVSCFFRVVATLATLATLATDGLLVRADAARPPSSPPTSWTREAGQTRNSAVAGLADEDPSNDGVVAPPDVIPDCEERLRAASVSFIRAELPVKQRGRHGVQCGAEQVVIYKRGPASVRYNAAPLVSCRMALGLARLEQILVEEAQLAFGKRVVRIDHGGTYNCRTMSRFKLVSEHSYANAIDIRSVTLENGRKLSVLRDFGPVAFDARTPQSQFFRKSANRLFDEAVFSVVITPLFDELHRDHLHLDQALSSRWLTVFAVERPGKRSARAQLSACSVGPALSGVLHAWIGRAPAGAARFTAEHSFCLAPSRHVGTVAA